MSQKRLGFRRDFCIPPFLSGKISLFGLTKEAPFINMDAKPEW